MTNKYEGHTPGPWRVAKYEKRAVNVDDGSVVARCGTSSVEQAHANARLIADAPLLLAQRDRLAEKMQLIASCVSHHKGDVVDIARAVLAELDKKAGK